MAKIVIKEELLDRIIGSCITTDECWNCSVGEDCSLSPLCCGDEECIRQIKDHYTIKYNQYSKSKVYGSIKCYQQMYDAIKDWNKKIINNEDITKNYLFDMIGHINDDLMFHCYDSEEAKNERLLFIKVFDTYMDFKETLEKVLGITGGGKGGK